MTKYRGLIFMVSKLIQPIMVSGYDGDGTRRRFLRALGVTGGVAIAGCPGGKPTDDTAPERTETETSTMNIDITWRQLPGPPGGPVTSVSISPADPEKLYVGTPTAGVYHSDNTAMSWTQGHSRLHHTRRVWASPHDPDVAYLPHDRSTDGGIDWNPYRVEGENGSTEPRTVAFDPIDPSLVYAGTASGISRSEDGGHTWSSVPVEFDGEQHAVWRLSSATNGDSVVLWAAHRTAVSRSTDRGQTWSVVDESRDLQEQVPMGIALAGIEPERGYYALNGVGVYRILNGEATSLGRALDSPIFQGNAPLAVDAEGTLFVVANPRREETGWGPGRLYRYEPSSDQLTELSPPREPFAVDTHPVERGTVFVGDRTGVVVSHDAGETWSDRSSGLVDGYLTTVATNEIRPEQVFAGSRCSGGVFRSEDLGKSWSWERSGIEPFHDGLWGEHYLMHYAIRGDRAYATTMSGLLMSEDGGETWSMLQTDFSGQRRTHLHGLAIEPGNPNVVYVGTGRLNAGGEPDAFDGTHLWKSSDGGDSWHELTSGFPTGADTVVQHILVDPHDHGIVYVATNPRDYLHGGNPPGEGLGVLKSTDAGDTWQQLNGPREGVRALAVDAGDQETVYASTRGGLYRSEDGGDEWERLTTQSVRALAAHPKHPGVLFVGLDSFGGAVEVSVDGGESFQKAGLDIQAGTADPAGADAAVPYGNRGDIWWFDLDASSGLLYAATDGAGLWRADVTALDEVV